MSPDSLSVSIMCQTSILNVTSHSLWVCLMATVVEMQSFLASELTLRLPSTSKISKHKAFLIGYASLLPSEC